MRPRRRWIVLFAILLAGAMPSGGILARQPARGQPYAVTGVVLSVGRGLLTLRLDGGGSATFRLVEGTALPGAPASGRVIAGARVQVWVLPVPDGPPVALRILLLAGLAPARPVREAGVLRGLVVALNGNTVSVLGEGNVVTTVLITGTTVISGGAILPRSVVQVEGTRNSDGSLSARSLKVLFDPRAAIRVTGRIAQQWPGVGFVLADGTVVTLSEDSWIVRGTALRAAAALIPGAVVTVLGVGVPPYITARVVDIAP